MKHLYSTFLPTIFLILLTASCSKDDDKDPEPSPLPIVTTGSVTSIKSDSAIFTASVTSEGQSAVVQRGFCWSINPNPTVSDNFSDNAFGPGSYSHTATGLSSNTNYFVRAYATNGQGTSYGSQVGFKTKYKIGDSGPAGGIVFYINETGGGMEAAPANTEGLADWGCPTTLMGGTSFGVGTGNNNTSLMLVGCAQVLSAATLCNDLVSGGKNDWFLPSKDELNLMYVNLHFQGLGSFGAFRYWSSSEENATNAWRHDFADGTQFAANKGIGYRVRAVRSF